MSSGSACTNCHTHASQPDDARLTHTTVLNESEEDTDDDGADDGEDNDGEVYSSRARGL